MTAAWQWLHNFSTIAKPRGNWKHGYFMINEPNHIMHMQANRRLPSEFDAMRIFGMVHIRWALP
jgi:hypothetical protein